MSSAGIHRGSLRKYGGFLFKQWKEKFLLLSVDGSLLVCPDANSPAELGITLGTNCDAILEGSEICNLPRLPLGAQRDSCLGLSLTDGRVLLFLAPSSQECRQWLNVLRKVKEVRLEPQALCTRSAHGATDPDPPLLPAAAWARGPPPATCAPRCLRHGRPARAGVRAACLWAGGAAAGPTIGHMVTSATAGQPGDSPPPPDFRELGCHPSACDSDAQYEALDYEGLDQDFDALDFGGFAF
ncbi:hypothetical protein lerEdw1_009767 [Lerista edwardsae]|nr:hypothetical protein lerEdw1_009767 [Lerista edwardsae]